MTDPTVAPTRRSFLAGLLALPLLGSRRQAASPTAVAAFRVVDRFAVAGYRYHQGPENEALLHAGQPLRLVREPQNPHDPRAIALYADDVLLGYVPRAQNSMAAGCLDQGVPLTATLETLDPDAPPWERVRVALALG